MCGCGVPSAGNCETPELPIGVRFGVGIAAYRSGLAVGGSVLVRVGSPWSVHWGVLTCSRAGHSEGVAAGRFVGDDCDVSFCIDFQLPEDNS
jgi:hypothetical protein